jgi:uncharacterized membrane protein YhaH (DUF805 family)
VTATRRSTAASEGREPAAESACRPYVVSSSLRGPLRLACCVVPRTGHTGMRGSPGLASPREPTLRLGPVAVIGLRGRRAPGWAAALLWFGVLAGLVGMHGLSAHGTQAMSHGVMPAAAGEMSSDSGHEGAAADSRYATSAASNSDAGAHVMQPPGGGHEAGVLLLVCFAVLAVALFAMTLWVRRLGKPWVLLRRRRRRWPPLRWPIRAWGAEVLTLLCVQRC